jgi:hypothetical protein
MAARNAHAWTEPVDNIRLVFLDHSYGKNAVKMWQRFKCLSNHRGQPDYTRLTLPVCLSRTRLLSAGEYFALTLKIEGVL